MRQTQTSSNSTTNIALIVGAVVFWLAGSIYVYQNGADWFLPEAASAEAEAVDNLFLFMLGIATFIFLMVETLLIGFAVRYGLMRDKSDETDGPPIHGNPALELIWTLIPSIIVFVLTIYSFDVLVDISEAKDNEFEIEVTAQRFFWEFHYPDDEYELTSNHILIVPEDETIRLTMTSQDVIHSFWVPDFRVKQDVMPGRTSELRFTPTDRTGLPADFELLTLDDLDVPGPDTACPVEGEEPAEEIPEEPVVSTISTDGASSGGEQPLVNDPAGYDLVCAELCGPSHGLMRGEVYVVTREEYDAYIETLKAKVVASEAQTAYAVRCGGEQIKTVGRDLFQKFGCNTCHTLADVGSTAVTGPNLDEIGVRAGTVAGFATPADYIRTSILNPNATIAEGFNGNIMPQNFADRIAPDELDLLVAYLGLQTGQ